MRIGIFDSGIGGEAVAHVLAKLIPSAEIITANDHDNVPYGSRTPDEIIKLTKIAIIPLIKAHCDVIIIACNTATTVAIKPLRLAYPKQQFVGIEPMIKPAALATKSDCIAVCATPRTLDSNRYMELKRTWANDIKVIEPDCSSWASLIEQGESEEIAVDSLMKSLLTKNVDVVVLGCTHFHWLKQRIAKVAPDITIMEPSDAIAERIKSLVDTTNY